MKKAFQWILGLFKKQKSAKAKVTGTLSIRVKRADGTIEDLGVVCDNLQITKKGGKERG